MSLHQKDINPASAMIQTWQPMQGPFIRWPRLSDGVLAVFFALFMLFTTTQGENQELVARTLNDVSIIEFFVFLIAGGSLYFRRSFALEILMVSLIATLVLSFTSQVNCVASLPIALYSVGRYEKNNRWSQLAVEGTILFIGLEMFIRDEKFSSFTGAFVVLFLLWYVGWRIRHRGEHLIHLQERAIQLEREREVESQRAVAEERTRIARELHDVVAHRVSLMTVQAAAAKTVAADNPAAALLAMEAVETAGRQALEELRHLVGILRPQSESAQLVPQSGLTEIPQLVEGFKLAGLDISLNINIHLPSLPSHLDLSTYRIVQEALTNVLKHAGPAAKAEVFILSNENNITIEVRDHGKGVTILPGSGHGIAGMRERAQLLGGKFKAGPILAGGFEVVAHLPITEHVQ